MHVIHYSMKQKIQKSAGASELKTFYKNVHLRIGMAQALKLLKPEWSDLHHPHISMCHPISLNFVHMFHDHTAILSHDFSKLTPVSVT